MPLSLKDLFEHERKRNPKRSALECTKAAMEALKYQNRIRIQRIQAKIEALHRRELNDREADYYKRWYAKQYSVLNCKIRSIRDELL